jgi:hypothetical protein
LIIIPSPPSSIAKLLETLSICASYPSVFVRVRVLSTKVLGVEISKAVPFTAEANDLVNLEVS